MKHFFGKLAMKANPVPENAIHENGAAIIFTGDRYKPWFFADRRKDEWKYFLFTKQIGDVDVSTGMDALTEKYDAVIAYQVFNTEWARDHAWTKAIETEARFIPGVELYNKELKNDHST